MMAMGAFMVTSSAPNAIQAKVWTKAIQECFHVQLMPFEPAQSLLRVGSAALKTGSDCSFTTRKLRILACFCLA
jgi:hypothetical protein